ncbi:MAG: hypothetical protein ACK5M7_04925 [Draconibacterium sp.]
MRKKWIIIISVFAFVTVVLSSLFYILTRETASWEFIQEVGGIKTGTPLETKDGFYLPIECNVSGLDSIAVTPTKLNSALSCIKTKMTIKGNSIHLRIVAGIAMSDNFNCYCKAVSIGDLEPGEYKVYYGRKSELEHQIGAFTIN